MNEENVKTNSLKAWILAARPKTLTGAAVPVMIALAMAWVDCLPSASFRWLPAVLCMLFAFVMQIDANFVNDYFDYIHGNDDETRLGPARACAMGWVTLPAMKWALIVTTTLGCIIGLPLVWYGGWEMIIVGILCVVFCFLYTTKLSYLGLGDLLVLVFFGIVPVCISYYLQTGTVSVRCLLASIACGLVIDTLLTINNYRDIDNDRASGKITLVVRMGAARARHWYLLLGIIAILLGAVFLMDQWPAFVIPAVVYLFLHYRTYREMVRINKGRELNIILGKTARNMFIYGISLSIGILL